MLALVQSTYYKMYAIRVSGTSISGYVHTDAIALSSNFTPSTGDDNSQGAEASNFIERVGTDLINAAHKQDTNWVFGKSDFSDAYSYTFEDANLLDALLSLPERLKGQYIWQFDQTATPWVLNLRRLDASNMSELRMNRNLTKIGITVDTADLVTCVYPLGAEEVSVETVNGGQRYVIAENMDESWHAEKLLRTDDETPQTLYESAIAYLEEHSTPTISVAVSAVDLSNATGETLDRLTLGKMCRVALPEYGITVNEHITRLEWHDLYGAPERIDVTLANRTQTASNLLAKLARRK